jgi:hypothetical protein
MFVPERTGARPANLAGFLERLPRNNTARFVAAGLIQDLAGRSGWFRTAGRAANLRTLVGSAVRRVRFFVSFEEIAATGQYSLALGDRLRYSLECLLARSPLQFLHTINARLTFHKLLLYWRPSYCHPAPQANSGTDLSLWGLVLARPNATD